MRPNAPWCTQCYAPGSAAGPAPAAGTGAGTVAGAQVGRVAEAGAAAGAGAPVEALGSPWAGIPSAAVWPCGACAEQNALADERCASCGEGFLGALRSTEALLVLPVVGDLAAMPPARRVAGAVAVVVAFLVLSVLLGLLLA